jgi:hypothetical protein
MINKRVMWLALERRWRHRGVWLESQKERDYLEDLSADGKIILKWILSKMEIHALNSQIRHTVYTALGMAVTKSALTAFGQTFTLGFSLFHCAFQFTMCNGPTSPHKTTCKTNERMLPHNQVHRTWRLEF